MDDLFVVVRLIVGGFFLFTGANHVPDERDDGGVRVRAAEAMAVQPRAAAPRRGLRRSAPGRDGRF
jgi:hypothetical protein